ncbi:class F sortase [Parasphingorhabdus pacifica]
MREPSPRRRWRLTTLVLAGVVVLVAVAGILASALVRGAEQPGVGAAPTPPRASATTASPNPGTEEQEPAVQPVHHPAGQPPGTVRLPEGGTADLVRRELEASGTLPVPDGVREATWWGAGLDSPKGATVLAGHVNWKGAVGPFAELWRIRDGADVTVVDNHGESWKYRVTEVHSVGKDELPDRAADLFGQGGRHRLVLVTCGGDYVGGETGYSENRIVVAEPVT